MVTGKQIQTSSQLSRDNIVVFVRCDSGLPCVNLAFEDLSEGIGELIQC